MKNWMVCYKYSGCGGLVEEKDMDEQEARTRAELLWQAGINFVQLYELRLVAQWIPTAPTPQREDDGPDSSDE